MSKILRFPGSHIDVLPEFKALEGLDLDILETALKMLQEEASNDLYRVTTKVEVNSDSRATAVAHVRKIEESLHTYDLVNAQLGAIRELRELVPDEPRRGA